MLVIRKARVDDIPKIYDLIKEHARRGLMLPRSLSDLYDVIRAIIVAEPEDSPGTLAGVCALHVCWDDLGEIRSLSVDERYKGSGLGRRLVEACFDDARELGLSRIFVLTYIPEFFGRLGFEELEKNQLPQKIWADCFKCVNFPDCGEIAMVRNI